MRQRTPAPLRAILPIAFLLVSSCAEPARERVDLARYERSVFSQFGEDGVIEKIFEIIEPTQRFCVEFGASDGVKFSNMRNLILNHGWKSFQIEGDPKRAARLAENYEDFPGVTTLEAWVWPGNIEILFEEHGVPTDLDFLVIDIDSNDYYVWRAIQSFRPKVVMIEANGQFPPPEKRVVEFHPMNYWDGTVYTGASLQSLYELGKKKGYELIHHMTTGANAFFVAEEYFERFGIGDNRPETLFHPPPPERRRYWSKFGGLDGEPFVPGKRVLTWEQLEIPKRFVER